MATLLIGGGGLIGSQLVQRLASDGRTLIVYSGHAPRNPVDGCQYYQGDVNELGSLLRAIDKNPIDCIIHNAGISSPMLFRNNPYKIYHTNVGGVLTSLEAARTCQARRYIYVSTAGVYDPAFTSDVNELTPRRATLPYRASKVACEELVRNYDLPETVSLRVSYVFGPGRTVACPIRQMVTDFMWHGAVNWERGIDQTLDMIHVSDVVEGISRVVSADQVPEREYNLAGGQLVSFAQIADVVSKAFPDRGVHIGAGDLGFSSTYLNMSRFMRDFHWKPETNSQRFEQMLLEYIDWIRQDLSSAHSL